MINNFTKIGFKKVTVGFIGVIIIVLFNVIFSVYVIQKNKAIITRMTKDIYPYMETLESFNRMVIESKMYATNWVYLQRSEDDKKSLIELHETRYPELKEKLTGFLTQSTIKSDEDTLKLVFKKFEDLLLLEKDIMKELATFDDYENPKKKFSAEDQIETLILPKTDEVMAVLKSIIRKNREEAEVMKNDMVDSFYHLMTVVVTISIGLFVVVLLASGFIVKSIQEPVVKMKDIVMLLGKGELPKEKLSVTKDIIGQMVTAVNRLTDSFSKTSDFANEIGKENFSAEFQPLSEKDTLGNALINMRDSLKIYSQNMEEKVAERTREVVEKNEKLEVAYGEIQDSIHYAKRIQEAILPSSELIYKTFKKSFIFYRPKDIVSGDFYWFADKGNEAIIAAVDCTGHGVPGALMTVVGNSLLNQIVNLTNVTGPAEILNHLDKRVLETLQQHGTGDTNDGMDVSICKYDIAKNELAFAGAKRSVYHFRNGKVNEIKGDKFPIGSFQYDFKKIYQEHTISLIPGDTVYLFSDGFQDQFGGPRRKKFMINQFRDLLTKIQHLSMPEQSACLEKEISAWRSDMEQTDDILVIGIRF